MGHGEQNSIDFRKGLERALARIEALQRELKERPHATHEPIAVIGMACRFPGIDDPSSLWEFLLRGGDAVREVPASRRELRTVSELFPQTRWASVFDSVDGFDADSFGISPREATWLDPQQRLMLEVSNEAIEDAGLTAEQLEGSQTGVFLGMIGGPGYEDTARQLQPEELDMYTFTGAAHGIAAGRIAYTFGLRGPAMVVDTACSSSLVSLHLACESLQRRECDAALSGGVNLILSPVSQLMAAKVTALSADGRCRTFDASANGIARGEGAAMVVLKRLSDARAAGDRVLAVVRGSAINHDGRAAGLAVPSVPAQEAVLRDALRRADVPLESIGYIETHGTGTSIGDPIELSALCNVFGAARSDGSQCVLGAIKTNLGHTESTAGIAGFIKCVLALQNRQIPQNLHFRVLNPRSSLSGTPLTIPTATQAWPRTAAPRRAGVSSFGMSGTNAHVVLEEAELPSDAPAQQTSDVAPHASAHNDQRMEQQATPLRESAVRQGSERTDPLVSAQAPHRDAHTAPFVLPLSARDEQALRQSAARFAALLEREPAPSLTDVCYSAGARRTHHTERLAVLGWSAPELAAALRSFASGSATADAVRERVNTRGPAKLIFVFSGFGSQCPGMGRELYEREPAFRVAFDACNAELEPLMGSSLLDHLRAEPDAASWQDFTTQQIMVFAFQVALSATWRSLGVEPSAVIGASLGEVAAAHAAGALTLTAAAKLAYTRAVHLTKLVGSGCMLSVELTIERAHELLRGYEGQVGIASCNSPRALVLSGETAALQALKAQLDASGTFNGWVKGATCPGHSPAVDRITPSLRRALADLQPARGTLPFYSTVSSSVSDGTDLGADYWVRNAREPVALSQTLSAAIRDGHNLLLELSPHPIVAPSMREVAAHAQRAAAVLVSQRRDTPQQKALHSAFAELFARGCPIDWRKRYPGGRATQLPTYPFQRKRFWVDAPAADRAPQHPLLGERMNISLPGLSVFQHDLRRALLPWYAGLRVRGAEVLPRALLIEMIAAGARTLSASADPAMITIGPLNFHDLGVLAPGEQPRLQLCFEAQPDAAHSFQLSRWVVEETGTWRLLADGRVTTAAIDGAQSSIARSAPRGHELSATPDLDAALAAHDIRYSAFLKALTQPVAGSIAARWQIAAARQPSTATRDAELLGPSVIEASLQAAAALSGGTEQLLWTRSLDRIELRSKLHACAELQVMRSDAGTNIELRDGDQNLLFSASGARATALSEQEAQQLAAASITAPASEVAAEDVLSSVRAAPEAERSILAARHVRFEVARVLCTAPDAISDDVSFQQLGMDSVVGLELRHRLEASFELELPATVIYTHPNVVALSNFILQASGLSSDACFDSDKAPATLSDARAWVLRPAPRGPKALRLLVFPFSGGSASGFVQWASRLPDHIELCAIELPGHGFRLKEPALTDFNALVDALDRQLAPERAQPYALFGHSMGALLAFELTRRWSMDGLRRPVRLFASGLPAPQWFSTQSLREAMAEDKPLEHLESWGAVSSSAQNRELLELGMPALHADLSALASWVYQPSAPLPCPITALRGNDDALTPLARTQDWEKQTSISFRLVTFRGGHFFLHTERGSLLRVLVDDLAEAAASGAH